MESAFHEGADSFNYQVSFPTGGKRLSKGLAEYRRPSQMPARELCAQKVPGWVVIVTRIAPQLPSLHWCQCRHH